MTFRGFLMWVHLVLGLTGAVVIAIASVTGAYITFQDPLKRWLTPVPRVGEFAGTPDLAAIVAVVESRVAPRRVVSVEPGAGGEATVVSVRGRTKVFVNPADQTIVGVREARFASLENLTAVMRGLHTSLLSGRKGKLLVTAATAEALILVLTGLWLWWRKKHWQFRAWRGSAFRVSWDLHSASGIWFLVPALSMIITGLLIAVPSPIYRLAGVAPAPWPGVPGSAVDSALPPIAVTRVLSVADSVVPGQAIVRLTIPSAPAGAYAVEKTRETVFIDQFSGAVLERRPLRVPTAGDKAYRVVDELHTGKLLGVPGQALMTLGSLMLVVMTVTGVILGWKRLLILARRARESD